MWCLCSVWEARKMELRRTDLAVEVHEMWRERAAETTLLSGIQAEEGEREGFPATVVTVLDEKGAAALGKPVGRYVTVELEGLFRREEDAFQRAVRAVAAEVERMAPPAGTALVVGLGNRAVTPDRIGPLAADHLLVTRHLVEELPEHFGHLRPVAAVTPGVLANTGVESSDAAAAFTKKLRPACVVAVDALAARSVERLCRTVQMSDTGISPGSGVGNHRNGLDRASLGVPVIAVGAPTVVDGTTLILDLLDEAGREDVDREALGGRGSGFFVTPREVDSRVAELSKVIGYGVSLGLNPSLTVDDLVMLLE
jgi:spore protease